LTQVEKWLCHLFQYLTIVSGIAYGVVKFLLVPEKQNTWSILNHPWQAPLQHIHIWLAPLSVFAIGMLFHQHITPKLRVPTGGLGRRTGRTLCFLAIPMIFSAYFLQTSINPKWKEIWQWMHIATSGGWTLTYLIHHLRAK